MNAGYENAPATKMLATHCAICSRPLVDSVSVEAGMGPDCRERYGYNVQVEPEAREAANKIVHQIATGELVDALLVQAIAVLRDVYGFKVLAETLIDRRAAVKLSTTTEPGTLSLETPYRPDFVQDMKDALPYACRRWDGQTKRWLISAKPECKNNLWKVMRRHFEGELGVAPDGTLFAI